MKKPSQIYILSRALAALHLPCLFPLAALLALLPFFAITARTAHAATATWVGSDGNWSDATQWLSTTGTNFSDNGNAAQDWDATVGAGTVALDKDITIQNFTLSGGVIADAGGYDLTINSLFTWTGGTLGTTGTTLAMGGISMDAVSGEIDLSQGTLVNAAGQTATFTGLGNLDIGNGATLVNSGTFVAQSDTFIENGLGGGGTFNNAGTGTFVVQAGAGGQFSIGSGITLVNNGTVNVQTGTLVVQGGGASAGSFVLSGTGTGVQFTANYTLLSPSSFSGLGTVSFTGATLSGTSTFNSALTFSGPGTWTGGTLSFANGGVTMDASASAVDEFQLDFSTLTNAQGQVTTFVGTGGFDLGDGAAIVNSGTFVTQNDTNFNDNLGNGGMFANTSKGTLNVQAGAGAFTIDNGVSFNNSGAVNVQSGTLSVEGGGTAAGSFVLSDSTSILQINTTQYNLVTGSKFSGLGSLDFSNGILSGATSFNSALTLTGSGTWAGAVLTFPGAYVTIDASNSSFGESQLNGSTLTIPLNEAVRFTGATAFDLGNGAAILNSGTFTTLTDVNFNDNLGGGGTFTNTSKGTLDVQAGAGAFTFLSGVPLNNSGVVNVQSGTLSVQGGGTSNGSFLLSDTSSVLQINSTQYNLVNGSKFSGPGTLDFSNGILSGTSAFNSALTLTGPGTWAGAVLTFPGAGVTIDASTSSLGESQLNSSTLTIPAGKMVNFVGTAGLDLGNGAAIINSGTFVAQNNTYINDSLGGGGSFTNNGVFTRNTGLGTFTIDVGVPFGNIGTVNVQSGTLMVNDLFNNSGTVNVSSSMLSLQGGGNATGSFVLSSTGPDLQLGGSAYTFDYRSSVTGAGVVDFNNGIVSGTATFDSALALTGPGTWAGGALTLSASGASMDASNSTIGEFQLNGSTLTNPAAYLVTYTGAAAFDLGNGAAILNSGTFTTLTDVNFNDNLGGGGTFTNTSKGTLDVQAGAGAFTFLSGVPLNNSGVVNVQSGTLSVQGGGTSNGSFLLSDTSSVLQINSTQYNLVNGSKFSGPGTLDFSNGILSGTSAFNSALTLTGPGTWAGAVLTFPGAGVTIDASTSSLGESQLNSSTLTIPAGKMVNFVGTAGLDLGNGAAIINSGTFVAQNNTYINDSLGGGGSFTNNGVFTRNTGTGTFTVDVGVPFTNTGTVNVQSGTLMVNDLFNNNGAVNVSSSMLSLQGGGLATGSFVLSTTGADLQFGGPAYTFSHTSSVTDAGVVDFNSGILSGTATFNASLTLTGPGTWSGGVLTFSGSGVSMDASNSTIGEFQLNGSTLTNPAAYLVTYTGAAAFDLGGGAAIVNSGTFVTLTDLNFNDNLGGGGAFTNTSKGTLSVQAGTGAFTIYSGVVFNNSGAVNVQSGTLSVQGGGTSNGSFLLSDTSSVLQINTTPYTVVNGSKFSGAGSVDFSNGILTGTTTFNSALTLTGPGTWAGAVLTFPGAGVTIDASTSVYGESQLNGSTLTNAAGHTTTFVGTTGFDLGNGAAIVNSGTFVAEADTNINDSLGGGGSFTNNGVFLRNTGTATFTIGSGITFNNPGTVNVQTGTLEIDGVITQHSGATLTGGTWVISNGATLFFNDGGSAITTNNADVTLGGPTAVFAAIDPIAINTGDFRILGDANFTTAGSFTNSGTLQLGGGTFNSTSIVSNSGAQMFGFGTINAPEQLNANVSLAATPGASILTLKGLISGSGALITSGPGTIVLSSSDTYNGGTTVTSGTLQLGDKYSLGAPSGALTVNAGKVDLHGFSPTVGALSGSGGGEITVLTSSTSTLTDNSVANTIYAGTLTDGAGDLLLAKSGSGRLTLSGSDNYSGGTTVTAGTLQLGNTFALGSPSGSLSANGGTMDLHGFSPTVGSLSGSAGALITTQVTGTSILTVSGSATTLYAGSINGGTGAITLSIAGGNNLTLTGSSNLGGNLLVANPGTVQIAGGGYFSDASATVAGTATVSGSGSKWTSTGDLYIGSSGTGTLAINTGGAVADKDGYIGNPAGYTGVVTVDGAGSTWTSVSTLAIGGSGGGTLAITGGGAVSDQEGQIGVFAGSTDAVTVSGTGSKWTNATGLAVGYFGTGTLAINSGGTVLGGVGSVGTATGSTGTVTVSGSGSGWLNTGYLYIGEVGPGTLTVTGGGAVTSGTAYGSVGGYIGDAPGSKGSVTVSGAGSKWTNTGDLYIGNSGTGTLAINTGAEVSDLDGYIANLAGSVSTVAVSGAGSTWTSTSNLIGSGVPTLAVGGAGTGTLSITTGGLVVSDGISSIANSAGSNGLATVSGAGSKWTSAGFLGVGQSGTGTLTVNGGGLVSSNGGIIGDAAGSTGMATVSGSGSKWINTGGLTVGNSGTGTLTITSGGSVTSGTGSSYIGALAGSSGAATVSGTGSAWSGTNNFFLGLAGAGTLAVTGGGEVSDGSGYLGYYAGSSGIVTVSGFGSTWTNTTSLSIGVSGTGILTLTSGALVTVTGTTTIASTGTLQFDGSSTLTTGVLDVNGGTLRTLDTATFADPATLGAGGMIVDTDGFNSKFSGMLSGTGGLLKVGAGTLALSASNSYSGGTTLSSGTLQLGNTFALGSPAGTLAVNAGTVDLHGFKPTVGAVSGSAGALITTLVSGTSTLTVSGTASTLYAGSLSAGAGQLVLDKTGGGTLTLTGSSNLGGTAGALVTGGLGAVQISGRGVVADTFGTDGGTVTVTGSGSKWTNATSLAIGTSGTGTLTLTNGGLASVTGTTTIGSAGTLQIDAASAFYTGALTVTGGTIRTLGPMTFAQSALLGAGGLIVDSGVFNSTFSGAFSGAGGLAKLGAGTLTLTGSSTYSGGTTIKAGAIQLGNAFALGASTGSLALDAGTLDLHAFSPTVSTLTGSSAALITTLASGTATLSVTGTASSLYAGKLTAGSGALTLAKSGGGTLTLTGSSTLGGSLVSGSLGSVTISGGGSVSDGTGTAGHGGGLVTVTGSGSRWTNATALTIGSAGSGTLSIAAGGLVSSASNSYLGYDAASTGAATLSGTGSKWTTASELFIGDSGKGTLSITAGGAVTDYAASIGTQGGSSGAVTVSGSGSTWTTTTGLTVGNLGPASLSVTAGGLVSDNSANIGIQTSGTVTLSGSGSKWSNTTSLVVGTAGPGTLAISSGAAVSSASSYIANGSLGTATLSGTGSSWTTKGNLYVGYSGTGTLAVTAGGALSSGVNILSDSYIGNGLGSNGAVTVSGSGSTWASAGNLIIGNTGAGLLTITSGGLVTVTGTTAIGPAGTLQIDGLSGFKTTAFTSNGGALRTLGAVTFAKTNTLTLGAAGVNFESAGFNSILAGVINGTGGLTKLGSGTLTLTGASTYTGPTLINAGALALQTGTAGVASLGNTAITVASGATFLPALGPSPFSTVVNIGTTGTTAAGGKLTLSPGSVLSMADNAIGTFNLRQNSAFAGSALVIGGTSGAAPSLAFDIGSAGKADSIDVIKSVSLLATGGKITIDPLTTDTSLTPGAYDLIIATGGLSITGTNGFSLSTKSLTVGGKTYNLTLANTATDEVLDVSLAPSTPSAPDSALTSLDSPTDLASVTQDTPIPAFSTPADLAKPALTTTAVPEPADWASAIATLSALFMLTRSARSRKSA